MRTKDIKVTITISIPFDKPNKNGVVYTQAAVENTVNHPYKNLPIIYRDNGNAMDDKVIGVTTGNSHITTWDFENQICEVTIDGVVFYGGTEYIVNEMKDNQVTDFEIVGIGLFK